MWVSWVLECVTSVTYSFLINGSPQGYVTPTRGLRQGDPLSPYLFILCTEVLSGLCRQAQITNELPGLRVSPQSPRINHLLFADDTMFFIKANIKSCRKLKEILHNYELASGQSINLSKSSVTFSKKMLTWRKRLVQNTLRITNEGGTGKYLGLPEHFGRRKTDIFAHIIAKVKLKAQSWSSRFLSSAGKQVMLKMVLLAMPTYAMSCFKLPVSICQAIQSILTRFWWDDKPDQRKISWVSWERLSHPLNAGGLGFKDISDFNEALLAKISWRLLKYPSSLLARSLLGKYCQDQDFMTCTVPEKASYGWKSLLAGRNTLRLGTGWLVGDGQSIKLWTDNWISTSSAERIMGPVPEHLHNLKVSDLMDETTNTWSLDKIRAIVPHYLEKILSLPCSKHNRKDRIAWLPSKQGLYTTRSGYGLKTAPYIPTNSANFDWQKSLWKLPTTPKIRTFLWRASAEALPVGSQLVIRGVLETPACHRCGQPETTTHMLLHCPYAIKVWSLAPLTTLHLPLDTTVLSFLQSATKSHNLPPTGLSNTQLHPWICWRIWTARNNPIFSDRHITEEDTLLAAIQDARSWQQAQATLHTQLTPPPPPRTLKPLSAIPRFNVDGAWNKVNNTCGIGCVITSTETEQATTSSRYYTNVPSPLAAEALAIKYALELALELQLSAIELCSDSQIMVNLLNGKEDHLDIFGLLEDLRDLCSSLPSIFIYFIPRNLNSLADSAAKSALYSSENFVMAH